MKAFQNKNKLHEMLIARYNGAAVKDLAIKYGCTVSAINYQCKNHNVRVRTREQHKLRKLVNYIYRDAKYKDLLVEDAVENPGKSSYFLYLAEDKLRHNG
jgi:hypothetical protein